jgi:hypothetical protein
MALTQGLQLSYGIQPVNPVPVDSWSGPYEGSTESAARTAANTSIPSGARFKSMEVRLIINGSPKKYWYANGILDSDLVEFFPFGLADSRYFPLTGGTIGGNTKVQGNLTVYGDLSSTGNSYFANTIYSTTSALSVINVGNTGPALYVGNNGSGDLASFYDLDTDTEVFHIGGANGSFPNVGVKTSSPNKDLTVNGEISAYGSIWTSGDFISGGREIFSIIYPDINKGLSVYTNVNSNSANSNSVYTSVNANSANWDSVYTNVSSYSATYATYDYVNSNFLNLTGGIIDGSLSVLSSFEVGNGDTILFVSGGKVGINTELPNVELTVIGSISSNNVIYDLSGNSNQWNSVYTNLNSNSANSNSVYTSVNLVSANWDSVYTSVLNTSANWDSTFTSVKNTSANWDSVYTNINSNSGNSNSVYTSVLNTSANWDSVYTSVKDTSANWDSTFTSVRNTSANWDSVYTNVSSYSATYATYNYVDSNFLNLTGGVINGNVSVLSSFEVGGNNAILFVSGGKVSVNTKLPTVELTVSGSISASNKIYGTIIDWMTLTRGFKIEPVFNSTIAGGDVYNYVYESSPTDKTYYRYIATDGSEDAYYETFSGGNLSNLIAKKKIIV